MLFIILYKATITIVNFNDISLINRPYKGTIMSYIDSEKAGRFLNTILKSFKLICLSGQIN